MKILVYGLNHAPELTGVGKFTGEMVASLAARGHDVRIITTPPYYPEWRIHDGFRRWWWARERRDGVRVLRCPFYVPRRPTGKKRAIHLASFAMTSWPAALWKGLFWRPHVVMAVEPTFTVQPMALVASRLAGAVSWLHVQDLEIDAAFALGLISADGRAARTIRALERRLLRCFHRITTITPNMAARLAEKAPTRNPIGQLPNWVDTKAIHPLPADDGVVTALRRGWGVAPDGVVALYSGNLGEKQGLEDLVEAARRLRDRDDVFWVICGEGSARARLEQAAADLGHVQFIDLQPLDRLNALLGAADIHMLPQRAEAADLVMPSKLGGMLASGRPVVAAAVPDTQLGRAVEGCGTVVPPGEPAALADAVRDLADDPDRRHALGLAARQRAETDWDREAIMDRLDRDLAEAVQVKRRRSKT